MKTVYLIGYMGSGKTTLGRAYALAEGCSFIDLDDFIEKSEGMSISEIFAQRGEDYFRKIESQALREISSKGGLIALGGGTPCHAGNMEYMNKHGLTIRLRASLPVLLRRLGEAREQRPLIAGSSDQELRSIVLKGLAEREPHYGKAKIDFNSDELESEEQVARSVARLKKTLSIHNITTNRKK